MLPRSANNFSYTEKPFPREGKILHDEEYTFVASNKFNPSERRLSGLRAAKGASKIRAARFNNWERNFVGGALLKTVLFPSVTTSILDGSTADVCHLYGETGRLA